MHGDLEGSPALTFAPLVVPADAEAPPGSLWAMMRRRYEAYKDAVVRPFFRDHFARLDRQIVNYIRHSRELPEAERKPDLALAAEGRLRPALKVLEQALAEQQAQGQSHLAAARFTVADLCVASVTMWIRPATALMSEFPLTAAWLKNCLDRPAHQAARKLGRSGR